MAAERMAAYKKNAEIEQRRLIFVDESGFYLLPFRGRTYAPKGQTPVLHHTLSRDHLSVISGLTEDGRLVIQSQGKSFCGRDVVAFLKLLLRTVRGKICVLWDNATIHRCRAVRCFLSTPAAERLHLERLPAYAPELNPDEGVWSLLKRALANVCCRHLWELKEQLMRAARQLCKRPSVLLGCLKETPLY